MGTTLPTWCHGCKIRLGGLFAPLKLSAWGGSPVTRDVSQAPSELRDSLPKPIPFETRTAIWPGWITLAILRRSARISRARSCN